MGLAETAQLAVELRLDDQMSGSLRRAQGNLNNFSGSVGNLGKKISNDLGQGVRNTARNLERLAFVAGGLAIGGGVAAVKWAGDFQAGMQTINTVAQATPAILGKAGEGIRSIFRETGTSMADLQQAEYDLVSAGIALESSQAGVEAAVKLGRGAIGSTAQAVDVLTTAINAYNLKAADGSVATATYTKLSDELAQAVADGKVTLDQIAGSYANVAAVAAQAGVGTNEIAAAYGFLTAKGVPAAEVTTQMSRAIVELLKPNAELNALQDKTKLNFADIAKEKGLNVALEQMRVAAQKAGIPFIDLFGRLEGYKFALQVTGDNAAGFATELDKIGNSAGETAKQFAERQKGLNAQMDILKANVQDAGITIGTALLPKLTELATKAATFLRNNQGAIADFATKLADGFQKAVEWAGKLDWKSIGDTIKSIGNFGASLAKGFLAMPTEAKELILGLYGLNKLSGGAVVNVGVDITKGLLGTFLGRGSPVNPMYVVSLNGGGPGGPPIPVPGGGPSTVTKYDSGLVSAAVTGAAISAGLDKWKKDNPDLIALIKQDPFGPVHWDPNTKTFVRQGSAGGTFGGAGNPNGAPNINSATGFRTDPRINGATGFRTDGTVVAAAATVAAHSIKSSIFTMSVDQIIAGIKKRSAAKYGGTGLGKDAVDATFSRDILKAANAVATSSADLGTKVGDLKTLEALLTTNGDTKTAKQIEALIAKLDPTAVAKAIPKTIGLSPDDRDALRRSAAAQREAAEAQRIAKQAINVYVTTKTSVSIRDQKIRTDTARTYGLIAGGV